MPWPQRVIRGLGAAPGAGGDALAVWAERTGRRGAAEPGGGGLRFVFYGRVSTEDYQDPVTSLARQRDQAAALVAGRGRVVAEFFDIGQSRALAWARRPQAAALVAALADPDRGWDAIVIGEYERAFYGGQYASMAPLFEHYGVQLWTPEVGGRIDFGAEDHEQTMLALGYQSKREITRTRIRVRTAMAAQTREQGRYLGGRPPYGYRLADAGPHPNKAHAAWGRRAHRLEPDPATAPVVRVDVRAAAGRAQRRPDHPGAERCRDPVPVGCGPEAQPAPQRCGVDAGHGGGDPGQPAVYRAAGVEPAAHRRRPGRPGQHRAGPPAGAAMEPARRVGHLQPARPSGDRQRGRLHRRPGRQRPPRARPARRRAGTCWPGCCAAAGAGGGWNPPGPTAAPPTGAATATPALPAPIPAGRRTCTSARTRSCPAWPPWPSCSPASPAPQHQDGATQLTAPAQAADLIDQLRAAGVTLTYDPATKTLRADTGNAVAVSVG